MPVPYLGTVWTKGQLLKITLELSCFKAVPVSYLGTVLDNRSVVEDHPGVELLQVPQCQYPTWAVVEDHPGVELFQGSASILPGHWLDNRSVVDRVGNFRQKNNSAKDGIDGTNGYFRRNSGVSAEQKISEFRSEPFRGRENTSEFRSVDQK
jgi:hypothetical protein